VVGFWLSRVDGLADPDSVACMLASPWYVCINYD
jgi:hypothetical protein